MPIDPIPAQMASAIDARLVNVEASILSLLRYLRFDVDGFEVPGELSLTIQATSTPNGDMDIDVAATLNQQPVFGCSL